LMDQPAKLAVIVGLNIVILFTAFTAF